MNETYSSLSDLLILACDAEMQIERDMRKQEAAKSICVSITNNLQEAKNNQKK